MAVIASLIASLALAITVVLMAVLALMLAGSFWLLWLHVRHRDEGLRKEAALLDWILPAELPHVAVQLPVFNEGVIVQRAIRAAAALDWPRDRLHIQVLDDSTDGTGELARAVLAEFPGHHITILHRENRAGFKAGALAEGMAALPQCDYFAILDVDYIPAPDFLKRTMTPLLRDPTLAFSQARFDYLNAETNTLTRIQAIILDAHLAVEQATRSWAGHPLPFNGTCGIWRRQAVEAAGGWMGDTLVEDMDLSYRAWLAGWRGTFLVTVSVPGELPAEQRAYVAQQRRWSKGSGEIARRMFTVLSGARGKGLNAMLGAILHLGTWWSTPLIMLVIPFGIVAALLNPAAAPWLGLAGALLAIGAEVAVFVMWRLGNKLLRPGQLTASQFYGRCLSLQALGISTILRNAAGYFEAILSRKSVFQRTPKQGA